MKRIVLTLTLVALTALAAFAQVTVNLTVQDSDGAPVIGAVVSLQKEGKTDALNFTQTDVDGKAHFAKIREGKYTATIDMMGYKSHKQSLDVKTTDITLPVIKLESDTQALDAASVSAVGNPITIKKDTVEYNASSFKTSDNDMLEDLLKKLPGLEVGSDGAITANGQKITKVLIDGKTFFLDDPSIASKNIPAKAVHKVRVVEKKSDQAQFTGIDDGEEEMVLDLSFKPGMMNGLFGNLMAGGGHDIPSPNNSTNDWRYQGAGMVGHFTKNHQISAIANVNNTNNRGFNDLARSSMTAMRGNSGGMGGRGGGGGWGPSNGITTAYMGGLNGAFTLLDDKMDLGANYLYNRAETVDKEESLKNTFKQDGTTISNVSDGDSRTVTDGHRFGARMDYKITDKTSILFEPQFSFNRGQYNERNNFDTYLIGSTNDTTKTNHGYNNSTGQSFNNNFSGSLLFRQKIGDKAGRTISLWARYNISQSGLNSRQDNSQWDASQNDSLDVQLVNTKSNTASILSRIVYTEPLGHDFYLELRYGFNWNRNVSNKVTTDAEGKVIEKYTNDILNVSQGHRAGANVVYQKNKLYAQLGAQYMPTRTINNTTGHDPYNVWSHNWAPQAMLRYEFGDNSDIFVRYNGRSSQPSTSQLIPVADNSDPMNIQYGNPYLKPYFTHSVRSRFGYTNKQTFTSVNANLEFSKIQDGIVSAKWYSDRGVQYSIPVNGVGKTTASLFTMVNSPIAKSNFSISSFTNISFTNALTYVGTSKMNTEDFLDGEGNFIYAKFNEAFLANDGLFDLSNTNTLGVMQRLRFTYRNDWVEARLGGRMRVNKSWYSIQSANQKATWNNQVDASVNFTLPWGMNIISDCNYNFYFGYTTPQRNEVILNAEITQLLCKNKLTLALKGYDLLGQARNHSVTDNENIHSEIRNNTLGRYVILSLTWRFGDFGKAGKNMRGGMGGGRGPGGPGGYGGGPRF